MADGGEDGTSFFGVLDGHGGRAAAREARSTTACRRIAARRLGSAAAFCPP